MCPDSTVAVDDVNSYLSYDVFLLRLLTENDLLQSEKAGDSVRAVSRALDILQVFTAEDDGLSAAELLNRVDLSRPTLYRLLYTLEEKGFIVSSGEPQRFRLGPAVAKLVHVWLSNTDIAAIARPVMRKVWEATDETVALFVPQGLLRTCVAEIPSPQPLNFKRGVGYSERIVLGASGRAILAGMSATSDMLVKYTEGTNADSKVLLTELDVIRKRGYAVSKSELIEGAVAVAAAFHDRNGEIAGSLGVFGPAVRMNSERISEIGRLLIGEALNLSRELGYNNSSANGAGA
jgi:IclR family acetate operon transcriptional repressor